MAEYTVASLAVNAAVERLCKKWGTEKVHGLLRDWVAYMDRQMEIMCQHNMDTVGRSLGAHSDGEES